MSLTELFARTTAMPGMLRSSDAGLIVILALFTWWGARRGALRQLLSLGVVIGALVAAGHLAPKLVPTVNKLTTLDPGEPLAVAWASALFLALVLGAICLRFVTGRMPKPEPSPANRWIGAGLGLAKGVVISVVVGYTILASAGQEPAPALSRPAGDARAKPTSGLVDRMRGSLSAEGLARGADLLQGWVGVPPWIQDQIETVNQQLDADA